MGNAYLVCEEPQEGLCGHVESRKKVVGVDVKRLEYLSNVGSWKPTLPEDERGDCL